MTPDQVPPPPLPPRPIRTQGIPDLSRQSKEEAFLRGQLVGVLSVIQELAYQAPLEIDWAQLLTGVVDAETKRIGAELAEHQAEARRR